MKVITQQVQKYLKDEGKKKGWLVELLNITYPTMQDRFARHNWKQGEIWILKNKKIIKNG